MSGDLRAAVEGHSLAHERHLRDGMYSLYCVGCGTWPPPEGAVLVTEKTLAAALWASLSDNGVMRIDADSPKELGDVAAAILRHLREGT